MEADNVNGAMEQVGQWYYDNGTEAESTFRICSNCGAVYHIQSGDSEFNCCPKCFVRMVVK